MPKNFTQADMQDTPWCYMPPEMHFGSPQELKEAFWAFALSRVQDNLNDPQMGMFFLPPANKFEKVRSRDGKYILLPTAIDNSFVFRGQTDFYNECLPTLYRKKDIREVEELIERLRCCEFEVYLKQLPQVAEFEQQRFNIDYLGLSQHYGLKTNVIDLTNSLDVALFFAMCNMSKDGKTFTPQQEDKEYIGYIYAVGTTEFGQGGNDIKSLFDGKLSAIGMQPFYRPGNQRGFGLHLKKGEPMTGLLYSFSYTKAESEHIYQYFSNGNQLWHEDEISRVAREIRDTKTFSYTAMNLAFKRYYKRHQSEQKVMKQRLQDEGCKFQKHSLWEIDRASLFALQKKYAEAGGFEGMTDIVQRATMDSDGKKKHCIDTKFLTSLQMLQFPISGCKSPDGYDSPYNFSESEDKQVWGFSQKQIKQAEQTKPNPTTRKVDKWTGDWRSLQIEYHREKKLKMQVVKVPKKK